MVLTGYPPMDLLERDGFVRDQLRELETLHSGVGDTSPSLWARWSPWNGLEVQTPRPTPPWCWPGASGSPYARQELLPTYDVFDEKRYFAPAERREPVAFGADRRRCWVSRCARTPGSRSLGYRARSGGRAGAAGAVVMLNPPASPWHVGQGARAAPHDRELARATRFPIVFVNQVGGNDELIFDGGSFVAGRMDGRIHAALPLFEPGFGDRGPAGDADPGVVPEEVADPDTRIAQLEAGWCWASATTSASSTFRPAPWWACPAASTRP